MFGRLAYSYQPYTCDVSNPGSLVEHHEKRGCNGDLSIMEESAGPFHVTVMIGLILELSIFQKRLEYSLQAR